MTIAAHIDSTRPAEVSILYHCIQRFSDKYPEDHFIYFIPKQVKSIPESKNCTPVLISPPIKNSLLLHYWYNFKLPSLLSRYNADVFISEAGICSLQTDVPQYMVLTNVDFLTKGKSKKNDHALYKRKFFSSLVKKVAGIAVTREIFTEKLKLEYPATENKTKTIYHGLNDAYQTPAKSEKELIKARHSGDKDFFLFYLNPAGKEHILPVLKAFSQFKKWQRSNMQLILLMDHLNNEKIVKKINSFKYRNEVKIIQHTSDPESAKIIGSAYALISAHPENDQSDIAFKAMKCEVPLIYISDHPLYEDAAIHTLRDEKAIAEAMMMVYKDEHIRKKYITKGKEYVVRFSWDNTAELLWNVIKSVQS